METRVAAGLAHYQLARYAVLVRLGIDLGTTRTVVAVSDRGNYPVVGFPMPDGDLCEFVPTVSAEVDGALVHGHVAERAALEGAPSLRSWKRLLSHGGPDTRVKIGTVDISLLELTTVFLRDLAQQLRGASNMPEFGDTLPEAVVSVPANAHSGQRFVTLEAFRGAGFVVRAMVNEPSAAAIEYAHRYRKKLNSKRDHVVVYDLGGGTFDAALVSVAGAHHEVIDTSGIQELGGDDFDAVLLEMALDKAGLPQATTHSRLPALLEECRAAKEGIGRNTKRLVLELAALGDEGPDEPVVLKVVDYFERLRPYIEHTLRALSQVMAPGEVGDLSELKAKAAGAGVAGVYVVGGASGLPVVGRILRERFKHRVQRSVYPSASTAIGLAIAADEEAAEAPQLQERFTRHLGVFREANSGTKIVFDQIFARGTPMPTPGSPPLIETRTYRAAHNVGHFRFVECGALDTEFQPKGDISPQSLVLFSFDPASRKEALEGIDIERMRDGGRWIEERYQVDEAGIVVVTISDLQDGYCQRYVLG